MQLMEVRSAKLPRGFSACGVGHKPPRRRQWPSIPFPSSPPHPILSFPSFPTAAVSHSLHLSDSPDLRERIVRRWWVEVAIERGTGVRHSFRPQDLEANFREHWPDSFPLRPHPRRSFTSFSLTAYPASFALPLPSFRERETTVERKLRKYSRWLTAESSFCAKDTRREEERETKKKKMKRREGGLRFRIPGLDWFESITIRFWASIAWRSTMGSYFDSYRHIIVLHVMSWMTAFHCPFRWVYQILWRENVLTWQLVAWHIRSWRSLLQKRWQMIKGKTKFSFCYAFRIICFNLLFRYFINQKDMAFN